MVSKIQDEVGSRLLPQGGPARCKSPIILFKLFLELAFGNLDGTARGGGGDAGGVTSALLARRRLTSGRNHKTQGGTGLVSPWNWARLARGPFYQALHRLLD